MTVRYCHLAPENLRKAIKTIDARENGDILVTVGDEKETAIFATA